MLMMLMVVVALSACSFGSETKEFEQTAVLPDGEMLEEVYNEIIITYKEDNVISIMTRNSTDYSILGVSNKKEQKSGLKKMAILRLI